MLLVVSTCLNVNSSLYLKKAGLASRKIVHFSFRDLPLPTVQVDDARLGASAEENGSKKTLIMR